MCKFIFYLPRASLSILQIFLPLIILIFLKKILIQFLTRVFFLDNKSKALYKIAPYYIASYFYFFFDCFLGLASCMSRAVLTNIISLLSVVRIDVSMFSSEQPKVIRELDRAFLAYSSYVKMEHFYNNAIVNGFCELICDSMLTSKSNEIIIEAFAFQSYKKLDSKCVKKEVNPNFNYKSFKRLRNLIFLCMFLKSNELIKSFRYHKWREDAIPIQTAETLEEYIKRKFISRLNDRTSRYSPKIRSKLSRKKRNSSNVLAPVSEEGTNAQNENENLNM